MILREPQLFNRDTGRAPAKNTFLGNVEQYFKASNNTCVHFGKNGNGGYSVIKLLTTDANIDGQISHADVCTALCVLYPNNEFIKDVIFFAQRNIDYKIVIINDDCDWSTENNCVLVVDFHYNIGANVAMVNTISRIHQKNFQQYLVDTYGKNRTRKPLIYATTNFEGYLSDVSIVGCQRQDITLFPGDVDLLTYSKHYHLCDIFEFKKHTPRGGNSTLAEQSFLKYINKDRKKYQGLAELAHSLGKDYFYNVLYSTRKGEENIVKIEKVSCTLQLVDEILIEYDTNNNFIAKIKNFTNNNY